MRVSPQTRKRHSDMPETWNIRAVSLEHKGKLTSLPVADYDTEAATLYHEC